MADVHTKIVRSYNMSQIKGKNTKPEIKVRKYLFNKGFRYRINVSKLAGKPDIVLSKYKTVIFINGCFWHGHENCSKFVIPKTNTDWWLNKIYKNKERDHLKNESLIKNGWNVVTIWECQLHSNIFSETMNKLLLDLEKQVIKE